MPLRYLTPFAFLALLPLGGWAGGAWTFIAAAATPLGLASLDEALGEEGAPGEAPDGGRRAGFLGYTSSCSSPRRAGLQLRLPWAGPACSKPRALRFPQE